MSSLQAQSDTTQSLTSKARSFINSKSEVPQLDSVSQQTQAISRHESLENLTSHSDSLPKVYPNQYVQTKADSLQRLTEQPSEFLQKKTSALKDKIRLGDSLKAGTANAEHKLDGIERSVQGNTDSVRHRLDTSVGNVQEKIGNKVSELSNGNAGLRDNDVGLPEAQLPGADTPNSAPPINGLPAKGLDQKLYLPGTEKMDIPSIDINTKVNVPAVKVPGTEQLEKVDDVTEQVKRIDNKFGKAETYEKEITDLKTDAPEKLEKLPEDAEKRLTDIEVVKKAVGKLSKAEQIRIRNEAMLKQYRDKKLLTQEIKRKSENLANDLFLKNADKVKTAQDQLSKSKQAAGKIKNVRDVFTKRSTELEGRQFYQRLVPGITWQIYTRQGMVSADLAFQIGYRITPKVTLGSGAIYRLGFGDQFDYYVEGLNTYGIRGYVDLSMVKGFFFHGEFETMKLDPHFQSVNEPPVTRTYGSYFGLGKRISLSQNLRGNVFGLYRINYNGELPNVNQLVLRFGLEYSFKKTRKK